jgi:hypothetical protein
VTIDFKDFVGAIVHHHVPGGCTPIPGDKDTVAIFERQNGRRSRELLAVAGLACRTELIALRFQQLKKISLHTHSSPTLS